ncbi:TYW4 protein, partial [Centropus bengalensis]|nr:TYW4 protein [Centropus bengalensis]
RGYYIRARAVDHCVRDFLRRTRSHPRSQILSLGAGFDSLFFRLKDLRLLSRTVVYEVDFPAVAQQKAALIRRNKELSALVGDVGEEGSGMVSLGPFLGREWSGGAKGAPTFPTRRVVVEEPGGTSEPIRLHGQGHLPLDQAAPSPIPPGIQHLQAWCNHNFSRQCPHHLLGCSCSVLQGTWRCFIPGPVLLMGIESSSRGDAEGFLFQGWTECTVVDMNDFFTSWTPEEEKRRVQALEPFDEFEEWHLKCSHYFILAASKGMEPPWTPLLPRLVAPPHDGPIGVAGSIPAASCASNSNTLGLRRYGHRSVLLKPDVVLTVGGFGEEDGQHCRVRSFHVLEKRARGWEATSVRKENAGKTWGERLFHTISCLSESLALLVGGRTSPSSPGLGMAWLKLPGTSGTWDPADVVVEPVDSEPGAEPPAQRWRHSTTQVTFKGEKFLFLYGGRSSTEPVLGDWCFLHAPELSCTVIPVEGPVPENRHSHSSCGWEGGAVVAGGLGEAEKPLGSIFFLREHGHGFRWQPLETHPPLVPRYSHTAHVHHGRLLLVGGVWLRSSVPGITVVDLMTGLCLDYTIDVEHLEWPLMLHNHSSILLPEEKELLVLGGGGNCFSFGTHLNSEPVLLNLNLILTSH